MAFVKVNKHNKEIEIIHQIIGRRFDETHQILEKEIDNQNRERDVVIQEIYRKFDDQNRERDSIVNDIYRTIDSRLDKLDNKLSGTLGAKQIIN